MSDDPLPADDDRVTFRRGVVRPVQCLNDGWQLVKDQYGLFLGITLVGTLIAGMVPFNILLGPMMCGIYYCLLRRSRGRSVKFEMLFKGFDGFLPSLIASLLMLIPLFAVLLLAYALLVVGIFATLPRPAPGAPAPGPGWGFFGMLGAFYVVLFAGIVLVQVLFFFAFPLITDRKLGGVQAVKVGLRAVMGNFGGVLGLVLLTTLLNLVGSLACCVGWIFLLPIHQAAVAVAYQRVFDLDAEEPQEVADYGDPEPRPAPPVREPG